MSATCTCGTISLRGKAVSLNWAWDCAKHGLGTEWYDSPEQTARREDQWNRTRELQRQAAEARRNALAESEARRRENHE